MAIMKVLSEKQNLLLREFCKTFPPVINEKRPTGDVEMEVPKPILDDEELCGAFLNSIWESKGWDLLGTASQMNEFMLFRTAPDVLFIMPFFRNIGYHPYTDRNGVKHNDEPKWWLGDNNYWNKSLRLFKRCYQTNGSKESFAISFRNLDNKSLSQIRQIQVEKMEESFVKDDLEVLRYAAMGQIHFRVPFYTYRYPAKIYGRKQKLGITIEGEEYNSIPAFTAKDYYENESDGWMFIAPAEPEMKVLNWAGLNEEQLREFISVL